MFAVVPRRASRKNHGLLAGALVFALALGPLACGARTGLQVPPRRNRVTAGHEFTFAVLGDGSVWAWGRNVDNEFGLETPTRTFVPVEVPGLADAQQIALGLRWGCALRPSGTVDCWGHRRIASNQWLGGPRRVSDLSGVVQISILYDHGCAVIRDGHVRCWGLIYNAPGSPFIGTDTNSIVLADRAVELPGLDHVVQVSAGGDASCALRDDRTVHCWGMNHYGQLGRDPRVQGLVYIPPAPIPGITDAVSVAAGVLSTCVLRASGLIRCWGSLGGDNNEPGTPVRFEDYSAPGGFTRLAIGSHAACGIDGAGYVRCFGYNTVAQFSRPSISFGVHMPGIVEGVDQVVDVSVGDEHACVVRADNAVVCFGANYDGEIGEPDPPTIAGIHRMDLPPLGESSPRDR